MCTATDYVHILTVYKCVSSTHETRDDVNRYRSTTEGSCARACALKKRQDSTRKSYGFTRGTALLVARASHMSYTHYSNTLGRLASLAGVRCSSFVAASNIGRLLGSQAVGPAPTYALLHGLPYGFISHIGAIADSMRTENPENNAPSLSPVQGCAVAQFFLFQARSRNFN